MQKGSIFTSLDQLPREILIDIGTRLFLEDIASLSAVSRAFYTLFDPLLYQQDSKPYYRHGIYWAAQNASLAVAQKALDAGTPVNDRSNQGLNPWSGKLQHEAWPEFVRGQTSAAAPMPLPKRVDIPINMTAVVELLLQAGADMSMLDGDGIRTNMHGFLSTPLGSAMHMVDRQYFDVVRSNHAEVGANGCFSPLTRAKLAVVGGHMSQLQDIMSLYFKELDLKGHNGRELHLLAYKDDRQDMCRCLYYWTYGKEADANYLCDSNGRFIRYLVDCAQRSIDAGGTCAYVKYENEWAELRSIRGMHWAFMYWIQELGKPRRAVTLLDVAVCIRDRQLLELAVSLEGETLRTPEAGQLKMLWCACVWGDAAWTDSILDDGLDLQVDRFAQEFEEILYEVIREGHADCVQVLLRRGPPINDLPASDRRSLIAEAIMYCKQKSFLVPILKHLFAAGADATRVFADLETWYPPGTGYWLAEIGLRMLCQPGCIELLEEHGIYVYRPHMLYLYTACEQHNYALVSRLVRDGVLRPCFREEEHTTGLLPRTDSSIPPEQEKNYKTRNILLHDHCQNLFPSTEYAADDVKILKALLAEGLDVNFRHYGHSVLEYACLNLRRKHSHSEEMISCLLESGAKVDVMEKDMGFAVPDKSNVAATSRYLLNAMVDVWGSDSMPFVLLEKICRSEEPAARKRVEMYMAHNPDAAKDKNLIDAAMIHAAKANNVGTLQTLMRYKQELPGGIVSATLKGGVKQRLLNFIMAISVTVKV